MSANMCAPTNKKDLDPDAAHFTFTSGARPSAPAKSVKCSLRLHATLQRWLHSRLTLWILRLCLQFSPCGALSIHKLRNAAACFSCRSSDPLPRNPMPNPLSITILETDSLSPSLSLPLPLCLRRLIVALNFPYFPHIFLDLRKLLGIY